VTHDVKNLLQSLRSLCSAAAVGSDADPDALLRLIQRQLPQITQRLQTTLDKLDTPRTRPSETMPSGEWWSSLVQRYAHEKLEFESTIEGAERVNSELFDSVADNLIQNALEKRRRSPVDRITVRLDRTQDGRCRLAVEDAGEPLSDGLVSSLFSVPVSSETGLGVGLFQCHKQADDAGYALSLDSNEIGAVRFVCEPGGFQPEDAESRGGQS
jgi:signal transduction histidine kinase